MQKKNFVKVRQESSHALHKRFSACNAIDKTIRDIKFLRTAEAASMRVNGQQSLMLVSLMQTATNKMILNLCKKRIGT